MPTKKLTEDEAISLITIGVDFGITQVVDGNWGVHAVIKKDLRRRRDLIRNTDADGFGRSWPRRAAFGGNGAEVRLGSILLQKSAAC
jgi:hypothetical protein